MHTISISLYVSGQIFSLSHLSPLCPVRVADVSDQIISIKWINWNRFNLKYYCMQL